MATTDTSPAAAQAGGAPPAATGTLADVLDPSCIAAAVTLGHCADAADLEAKSIFFAKLPSTTVKGRAGALINSALLRSVPSRTPTKRTAFLVKLSAMAVLPMLP